MPYACPAWEFASETYLLKLQRLQNKVFRTMGNLPRRTLVRDMHVAFQIPYVYDYITKLCRRQAEIIYNYFFISILLFYNLLEILKESN
jgi:hypothetical protein